MTLTYCVEWDVKPSSTQLSWCQYDASLPRVNVHGCVACQVPGTALKSWPSSMNGLRPTPTTSCLDSACVQVQRGSLQHAPASTAYTESSFRLWEFPAASFGKSSNLSEYLLPV